MATMNSEVALNSTPAVDLSNVFVISATRANPATADTMAPARLRAPPRASRSRWCFVSPVAMSDHGDGIIEDHGIVLVDVIRSGDAVSGRSSGHVDWVRCGLAM